MASPDIYRKEEPLMTHNEAVLHTYGPFWQWECKYCGMSDCWDTEEDMLADKQSHNHRHGRFYVHDLPLDLGDGTFIVRVRHYGGQDPDLYREVTDE